MRKIADIPDIEFGRSPSYSGARPASRRRSIARFHSLRQPCRPDGKDLLIQRQGSNAPRSSIGQLESSYVRHTYALIEAGIIETSPSR
jgi:hypothetical protein